MDYESQLRSAFPFSAGEVASVRDVWEKVKTLLAKASELINVTPTDGDRIIAAALNVYDQVIAPLDIPGIPGFLEVFVDAQLRNLLEAGLRRLLTEVTA